MDATSTFFANFSSGQLPLIPTHAVLLGGAIVAEILVAIGILLESPKEKTFREWLGLAFVFGGVVISAAFTIGLFVFDEGISRNQSTLIGSQQADLIRLMRVAGPRNLTKEEIAQGSHELSKYSATYDLTFPPNDGPISQADLESGSTLPGDLVRLLHGAGWVLLSVEGSIAQKKLVTTLLLVVLDIRGPVDKIPPVTVGVADASGLLIGFKRDSPNVDAAMELVRVLNKSPGIIATPWQIDPNAAGQPLKLSAGALTGDNIHIIMGTKPPL